MADLILLGNLKGTGADDASIAPIINAGTETKEALGTEVADNASPMAQGINAKILASRLKSTAVLTSSASPTIGTISRYDSTAANRTPSLPALSGLNAGDQTGAQKTDSTGNTVTLTCAGSDTFDSGATNLVLRYSELRVLQVVVIGGTKFWKIVGGNTPQSSVDAQIAATAAPIAPDFTANRPLKAGELVVNGGIIYRRLADGAPATFVLGEYAVVGGDTTSITARLDSVEGTAVALDELETGRCIATFSATSTFYLSAANLVQRIGALTLVSGTAIAQSDTNYWTVTLQRGRNGTFSDIVSRTTRSVDGAAPAAGIPWNFDLRTWSGISRYLNKSDILRIVFTATGAPDPWTTPAATWRYEPGVVPSLANVVTDSFDRADSTTTMSNADTGQAWTALLGTWGISSNKAYCASNTSAAAAVVDAGIYDGTLKAVVATLGTGPGLMVRAVDASNNVFLDNGYNLYKRVAGTSTAIGSFGGAAMVAGDSIELSFTGNAYTLKVNGVARGGTLTDSSNFQLTATKHGLRASSSIGTRFEDFIVQAIV